MPTLESTTEPELESTEESVNWEWVGAILGLVGVVVSGLFAVLILFVQQRNCCTPPDDKDKKLRKAPQNLNGVPTSPTTIELTWNPPEKNRRIKKYVIDYDDCDGTQRSMDVPPTADPCKIELRDLTPATEYNIQVRGHSAKAYPPTNVTVKTKIPIPEPPRNLEVNRKTFDEIEVSWQAPINGCKITGYCVYYNQIDQEERLIPRSPQETTCTIIGLKPDTEYEIQVTSKSTSGEGKRSDTIKDTTLHPIPEQPSDLKIKLDSDTMAVSWRTPEVTKYIKDHVVRCYKLPQREEIANRVISCGENTCTIKCVSPTQDTAAEYEVQVAARSTGGEGEKTIRTIRVEEETRAAFLEEVKTMYTDRYAEIPRKPWSKDKEFFPVDELFVNQKLSKYHQNEKKRNKDQHIAYSDMFKANGGKRFILIGASGMGKSSLTCKMAYDWSVGRLPKFKYVILIKLRDVTSKMDVSEYIARKLVPCDKYCPSIRNLIKDGHTLLLLDGFDEFKHRNDSSNEIMKIIRGQIFTSATVVITTRPHHLPRLKTEASRNISMFNLCGFSQEDVVQYIEMYFKCEENRDELEVRKIVKTMKHLFQEIGIWDLVKTPIICLLLCFIYEQDQSESFPTKRSKRVDVYSKLMDSFQKVYEGKDGNKDWEGILIEIGKLALDMLIAEEGGRLVFNFEEVSKYIDPEKACKTGLIKLTDAAPSKAGKGIKDCDVTWYQFLHKSVQEFCSALYLHKTRELESIDVYRLLSLYEVVEFFITLEPDNGERNSERLVKLLCREIRDLRNTTEEDLNFLYWQLLVSDREHIAKDMLGRHRKKLVSLRN